MSVGLLSIAPTRGFLNLLSPLHTSAVVDGGSFLGNFTFENTSSSVSLPLQLSLDLVPLFTPLPHLVSLATFASLHLV